MEGRVVEQQPEVVSEVVVAMLGRDRHGGAPVLDRVVGEAAGRLVASSPSKGPSRTTLRAVEDLAQRGDQAGARLLLRAVARVAPDRVLDEAAERLRPPGAARRRVGVVASVVLAIGLLAGGVVVAVVSGADAVAGALLIGSVGPVLAARVAWVRHVPISGLTLQESWLWRSLGVLRPGDISDLSVLGDGRLRRATTDIASPRAQRRPSAADKPDISGWVGLAGVFGAVLCLVGGFAIPDLPPGAFLALMPVGAVVAALAVRAVLRSVTNRPGHGSSSRPDHSA